MNNSAAAVRSVDRNPAGEVEEIAGKPGTECSEREGVRSANELRVCHDHLEFPRVF